MTLHVFNDVEQGTDAWHDLRRGIVTASTVGKLLTLEPPSAGTVDCPKCKATAGSPCISLARKEPTAVKTYHPERCAITADMKPEVTVANNETSRALTATLVAERISDMTEETPITSDMWRGKEAEPFARDYYAKNTEAPVSECGFMIEDRWGFSVGYSPDALVGEDGLLEVKAPRAKTHLLTVLADEVPVYNMAQLQCGLLVTGRKWADFLPFVGGLPLWTKRVYPDPAWHAAILAAVANFETTAAEMVAAYAEKTKGLPDTERLETELEIVI